MREGAVPEAVECGNAGVDYGFHPRIFHGPIAICPVHDNSAITAKGPIAGCQAINRLSLRLANLTIQFELKENYENMKCTKLNT